MFTPHNCMFSAYIIGFNSECTRSNFIIESSFRDFKNFYGTETPVCPAAAGQELHLSEIERKTGFAIGTVRSQRESSINPLLKNRIIWD